MKGLQADPESSADREDSDLSSSARASLEAMLHPGVIGVVGASSDPATIAGLLFANLLESRFQGTVLPVNSKHALVQGVVSYPDLASCPVVPDLAIICVPAAVAVRVVAQAGDVGGKAACVISAGFAETGESGSDLQNDLVKEATSRGMRLVGPNCTGILSGTGSQRFNATFSRTVPRPGRTALLSQSGAVGLAVLEAAEVRSLGIGGFVSVGNSADVAADDLIAYWGNDDTIDLVLLYLESIQDPQAFIRTARRAGRRVPIVAVKAGRTEAGRRGAASHTAALAAQDGAVDAIFRQAGVIRAESIEEMVDLATVLSSQRRFRGRRVAIVTNGGGPGVLAADACETNGLVVPELSELTAVPLRSLLAREASVANPVDMIASATALDYGEVVRILRTTGEVDAVIVMYNTPLLTSGSDVAVELVNSRAQLDQDIPIIAVFMNKEGPPDTLRDAGIPAFTFPENAVRALGRSITWAERQRRPAGKVLRPAVDAAAVDRLLATASRRTSDGWLHSADAEALLAAYGVVVPRTIRVSTPEQAAAAQAGLGCTVVVKLAASIHKSDIGGVRLGLDTPPATAEAVRSIRTDLGSSGIDGLAAELLVQEQVQSGQEMIVGANRDEVLGPIVLVGLGGQLVELLGDFALGVAPLTDTDIEDMVSSLRSHRLLTGYRGRPALDVEALAQVLHRVSALVDDLAGVVEMDLNPVFVLERGTVAADVRIRISQAVG